MNPHACLRLAALSIFVLSGLSLAHAQEDVETSLLNANFKEAGADGLPSDWKASPGADPVGASIAPDAAGVKRVDNSGDADLGLFQWIDVNPRRRLHCHRGSDQSISHDAVDPAKQAAPSN